MIQKLVDIYLSKQKLKTVTEKEYENMINYRATRGELKRLIDDNNIMVNFITSKATSEDLRKILKEKQVEIQPHCAKEFLINEFIKRFKKEFKKSEK